MVLQDLPQTIEQITAGPAMEHMVHDFFTLQPVKGGIFLIQVINLIPSQRRMITTFMLATDNLS